VQPCWVQFRMIRPEREVLIAVCHEDVAAVEGQSLQPTLYFRERDREHFKRQIQIFRISKLGTKTLLMLDDRAPQVDLTPDSVPFVSRRVQVLKAFRRVHATSALLLRDI